MSTLAGAGLLRTVAEVVEHRHAVGLRPDAHLAGILERAVIPIKGLLAVKGDAEVSAGKVRPDRVPDIGRDLHIGPLLLSTSTVDRVVDRDVVFQGIRSGDVVVVRVPGPPD